MKRIRSSFRGKSGSESITTSNGDGASAAGSAKNTAATTNGNRNTTNGGRARPAQARNNMGAVRMNSMNGGGPGANAMFRRIVRRASVSNYLTSPLTAITTSTGEGCGLKWAEACMQGVSCVTQMVIVMMTPCAYNVW